MSVTITANQVKELRELTGAGMMECKKALTEANGDIEAAIKAMREAGITKAAKKAGRIAAEGRIATEVSDNGLTAAMVEVNCETDFVARDSNFVQFSTEVVKAALQHRVVEVEKLCEIALEDGRTVEQVRQELVSKLGENIQIRRIGLIQSTGIVGCYTHGGRIGALVALSKPNTELAKDLAMHIAAANPLTIHADNVPADLIENEKEIFRAQSKDSGKSADIIEKMIGGRIQKFLNEVTLLGQPFVKDPAKNIATLLKEGGTEVSAFIRFEVGEGIEKVVEDFAQAVRAQVGE
ncbi:MAG: translation elongation factor Ts [Gammaproteobacteria bacterium]